MHIMLELDTRYHERHKEKGRSQEKKPPVTGTNSLRPHKDSSSKKVHDRRNKEGKDFEGSKDKPYASLLNKDMYNKLIGSEKERRIMSQPRVWPSSLMAAAIQPGAQMGPIGHVMSIMANWPPWVFYGFYAIAPLNHHLWPQAISCHHWPSWPISTSPTPRPSSFILGLGGPFIFQGVLDPLAIIIGLWPTPFIMGVLA
ncbi:hypothetical protein O181_023359 [Austropuccinia psidii MF-1]|uniref:Uncharacterized protein n=1 Tax=Austropuccinia psidii MF-1 TaxID=1389203 RepID=A0A9Q3CE90_9BASI|nr:hypothetical protein [Austropuccinia psidii MF-1]